MKYDVVVLEEKCIAGLSARTNNSAPDMGMVIGGLWQQFYEEGIYQSIPMKVNQKALGVYTDYAGNEKDDYTFLTACEVSDVCGETEGVVYGRIPRGRYARFVVKGDMRTAVIEFWQQLWQMDLPRSFVCDFEEYQNEDMEQAEIHIYIGLTD